MYSTGATAISELLKENCTIQSLVMYANDITTTGARLILESAVNSKACQANIWINDDYKRNSEVQRMMDIMERGRKILRLVS